MGIWRIDWRQLEKPVEQPNIITIIQIMETCQGREGKDNKLPWLTFIFCLFVYNLAVCF